MTQGPALLIQKADQNKLEVEIDGNNTIQNSTGARGLLMRLIKRFVFTRDISLVRL